MSANGGGGSGHGESLLECHADQHRTLLDKPRTAVTGQPIGTIEQLSYPGGHVDRVLSETTGIPFPSFLFA